MAPRPSNLPTIFLGHGAAGTAASMQPYVDALEARGLRAKAVSLRRGGRTVPKAERAVPDFQAAARPGTIAGGHSYGGRVASLAAVETDYAALILLSYPLHRPGHLETPRTEHWPRIRCPVLLLCGESDPFAQLSLLKASVKLLPDARLVTYPGVGHGLLPVLDEAMDRVAAFVKETVRAR